MAKQTERRVNRAFIVPSDQERMADPPSDVQDAEAARLAAAAEANVGMAQTDLTSAEAEQARLDAAREWMVGAQQQSDEPPSGRDLRALTSDSDQGLIEDQKLRAWEAQQGREAPQAQTGEDAVIAGAVDADAVEAAREARFTDLENMHEANVDDAHLTGDPPSTDY